MSATTTFWVAIVLAGAVTFTVRSVLFVLAGRMTELPPVVGEVLRMIPPAALAALAVPPLLRPGGASTGLDPLSPELLAGVLAGVVAWRTRNLLATIAVGLVVVLALQPLFS